MTAAPPSPRLSGACIFMSASVPSPARSDRFLRVPDAAQQIEQAVVSLARAVLSEGGRLVFGGHPAISPLVAMVAGEYRSPRHVESREERPAAQIRIYQSALFRGHAPETTMLMFQLGMADIVWTPQAPGETYKGKEAKAGDYDGSLAIMREKMLRQEQPDCMVAIGGMEGVFEETRLYRELCPNRPIYVLERTGGASALLRSELGGEGLDPIDTRMIEEMPPRRPPATRAGEEKARASDRSLRREAIEQSAIPFPLIVQTIVDRLAQKRTYGK